MIVGFTITDFKGYQKEAVAFIGRVCILDNPEIAQNIVNAGPGVNIFSTGVTLSELRAQPFMAIPIEVQDGKYLLVSAVNFNLELLYNGNTLRLAPTEYIFIDPDEVSQFNDHIKRGFVKTFPTATPRGGKSIFSDGVWNDDGVWVDSDYWRD